MPPHVPQELIAAIIDRLKDDRESLIQCNSASKVLHEEAQRHLFAKIWIHNRRPLLLWARDFADKSKHARILKVSDPEAFREKLSTKEIDFILSFRLLDALSLYTENPNPNFSFFHGLSKDTLKTLHLSLGNHTTQLSGVLGLILSFPRLQNLKVVCHGSLEGPLSHVYCWHIPPLDGTLFLYGPIKPIASILFNFQFYFTTIHLNLSASDFKLVQRIVNRCSGTLTSLSIGWLDGDMSTFPLASVLTSASLLLPDTPQPILSLGGIEKGLDRLALRSWWPTPVWMFHILSTIPIPLKTRIFLHPTSEVVNLSPPDVALWEQFDEMLYDVGDAVVNYEDITLGDTVKKLFPKLEEKRRVRWKDKQGIYGSTGSASAQRTFP